MSTYESYETLKGLIDSCADDVAKSVGGNKAAGTRVRKCMQQIKAASQDVRVDVLSARSGDGPAPATATADTGGGDAAGGSAGGGSGGGSGGGGGGDGSWNW